MGATGPQLINSSVSATPNDGDSNSTQKSFRHAHSSVLRSWIWEISSLLVAAGLLTAMFVILSQQHSRPVEDWSASITLNSLMNLMSTFYRGIMVAIAAEIISQAKWVAFWSASASAPLPLRYLQDFENASRGILGAATLLPTALRRSPGAFCALLTIAVSFAVGPFIQQAIGTAEREVVLETGTASVPITRSVEGRSDYYRSLAQSMYGMWVLKPEFRGLSLAALTNPGNKDSAILPSCSTGNCTFMPLNSQDSSTAVTHASVGMCSACSDVTSLVTQINDTHFSLPFDGFLLNKTDFGDWLKVGPTSNLSWAEKVISSEEASRLRFALANITVFTMTNPKSDDHVAASCSLYPCMRSYSASVRNGVLTESLLDTTPMYPDLANDTTSDIETALYGFQVLNPGTNESYAAIHPHCSHKNQPNLTTTRILSPGAGPDYPSTDAPEECIYRMRIWFGNLLRGFYATDFFKGSCTWDARQGNSSACEDRQYHLDRFWDEGQASFATIEATFDRFATDTTNHMRLGFGREVNTTVRVEGAALLTRIYFVIRWQWLLLPALLLAIETVVLVVVVVRGLMNRGEEMVWKSNVLPFLYHGGRFVGVDGTSAMMHVGSGEADDGCLMTTGMMEADAARVKVRLLRGEKGLSVGSSSQGYSFYRGQAPGGLQSRPARVRDLDEDSLMGN